MKRAEVWQLDRIWVTAIDHDPHARSRVRGRRSQIVERAYALPDQTDHDTHAEALAHALAEVGLTEKENR